MSYTFEYDMALWKAEGTGRVYNSDATARAAAVRIFKARTRDANDELRVYEATRPEPRYVGKVAYRPDGETIDWFPPVHESE